MIIYDVFLRFSSTNRGKIVEKVPFLALFELNYICLLSRGSWVRVPPGAPLLSSKTGESAPKLPRFWQFALLAIFPKYLSSFSCTSTQTRKVLVMVNTHVSPKRTRNKLQGKLRRRTRNGNYSYRLTSSNGARKEFTLQTRNYDEAVLKASELDSIWLAPAKEIALA